MQADHERPQLPPTPGPIASDIRPHSRRQDGAPTQHHHGGQPTAATPLHGGRLLLHHDVYWFQHPPDRPILEVYAYAAEFPS